MAGLSWLCQLNGVVMKVILLNDGNYKGLESVKFPAEVSACEINNVYASIPTSEIVRIGGVEADFNDKDDQTWQFIIWRECEVIE